MDSANDDKVIAARKSAKRNKFMKWAWSVVLIPPSVIGYFVMDFETFVRVTSLVTLVLSVVALSLASQASQKGDESKAASYENP